MRSYLYKSLTLLFLSAACSAAYWGKVHVPAEIARIENAEPETWLPPKSESIFDLELNTVAVDEAAEANGEFFRRPLFLSSRRPFVPPPPPVSPNNVTEQVVAAPAPPEPPPVPAVDPSTILLKGIMVDGGYREALIVTAADPTPKWHSTGSRIDGWEVAAINDNEIVLLNGSEEVHLKQYVDKVSPAVAGNNPW